MYKLFSFLSENNGCSLFSFQIRGKYAVLFDRLTFNKSEKNNTKVDTQNVSLATADIESARF